MVFFISTFNRNYQTFVTLQKIFTLFQEIIIHFLKLNKIGIYWDIVDTLMT